ncbi:MAG: hypothetical protein M1820_002842 [Bogoriella megaspora]|nr:MAG: hypothetical protein M1820_002842 [Bogoriella megaspora]
MASPSTSNAPGMNAPGASSSTFQAHNQNFPTGFQMPANLPPDFNWNAPVLHLGNPGRSDTASQANAPLGGPPQGHSRRAGPNSGQGQDSRHQPRDVPAMPAPTREEKARTIFIKAIPAHITQEDLEKLFSSPGNLRRFTRVLDSEGKSCDYGLAEYEDVGSLSTATDVLNEQPINLAVKKQESGVKQEEGTAEATHSEEANLEVLVDNKSYEYIEEWGRRMTADPVQKQFKLDNARVDLQAALASIQNLHAHMQNSAGPAERPEDIPQNGETTSNAVNGEGIVHIPLSEKEDELADIPAEARAQVASEIAQFREKSIKNDMKRLQQEEVLQAEEKKQSGLHRISRLAASPPLSAPSGPAAGANNIPLGPRERGIQGAPSGPKNLGQISKEYQKGAGFVNGSSVAFSKHEDEDDSASDDELERRRIEKKKKDQEKQFADQERRWLHREASRAAALEREQTREKNQDAAREASKVSMAKHLAEHDDDAEAQRVTELYYRDHSTWINNRAAFRTMEAESDAVDRSKEARERAKENEKDEQARGMADSFLERQAQEMDARAQAPAREPLRFKMKLDGVAARTQQAAAPRRAAADVERLLEDADVAPETQKRTLIPLKFDTKAEAKSLTPAEREQAIKQVANEIPKEDDEALYTWTIDWTSVDEGQIMERMRPFVEKKIVDYLGVQEQFLVDLVERYITERKSPQSLKLKLEDVLDEDANELVKKVWRRLLFFTECDKRGLALSA